MATTKQRISRPRLTALELSVSFRNIEHQTKQTGVQFHVAPRPKLGVHTPCLEWSCRLRISIILKCSRPGPTVYFLRRKDLEMQIRSKAFGHLILICRSVRDLVAPADQSIPTPTSRSLAYAAAVLGLLLTILEVDIHQADLHLLGLTSERHLVDPNFLSP